MRRAVRGLENGAVRARNACKTRFDFGAVSETNSTRMTEVKRSKGARRTLPQAESAARPGGDRKVRIKGRIMLSKVSHLRLTGGAFLRLACVSTSLAQPSGTGALTGTVSDPIECGCGGRSRNLDQYNNTRTVRLITAAPGGAYRFALIPPGNYLASVTVVQNGNPLIFYDNTVGTVYTGGTHAAGEGSDSRGTTLSRSYIEHDQDVRWH